MSSPYLPGIKLIGNKLLRGGGSGANIASKKVMGCNDGDFKKEETFASKGVAEVRGELDRRTMVGGVRGDREE